MLRRFIKWIGQMTYVHIVNNMHIHNSYKIGVRHVYILCMNSS
jgi:hypothetical protein